MGQPCLPIALAKGLWIEYWCPRGHPSSSSIHANDDNNNDQQWHGDSDKPRSRLVRRRARLKNLPPEGALDCNAQHRTTKCSSLQHASLHCPLRASSAPNNHIESGWLKHVAPHKFVTRFSHENYQVKLRSILTCGQFLFSIHRTFAPLCGLHLHSTYWGYTQSSAARKHLGIFVEPTSERLHTATGTVIAGRLLPKCPSAERWTAAVNKCRQMLLTHERKKTIDLQACRLHGRQTPF